MRRPGYLIAVTQQVRRRRRKRRTFVLTFDSGDPDRLYWSLHHDVAKAFAGSRKDPDYVMPHVGPLTAPIRFAPGVDIPAAVLTFVFDTALSASKHEIDLDKLKHVVSQHGSHIVKLDELTAAQRQIAEAALRTTVLGTLY